MHDRTPWRHHHWWRGRHRPGVAPEVVSQGLLGHGRLGGVEGDWWEALPPLLVSGWTAACHDAAEGGTSWRYLSLFHFKKKIIISKINS